MAGKVVDHSEQFRRRLEVGVKANLKEAGIYLHKAAKELISISGTDGKASNKGKRDAKGKFLKSKLVYNSNPSSPGEPPHVQHGRLRGSVTYVVEHSGQSWVVRTGTNVKYGRWLELGTKKMEARPWLRVAMALKYRDLHKILSTPIPGLRR